MTTKTPARKPRAKTPAAVPDQWGPGTFTAWFEGRNDPIAIDVPGLTAEFDAQGNIQGGFVLFGPSLVVDWNDDRLIMWTFEPKAGE